MLKIRKQIGKLYVHTALMSFGLAGASWVALLAARGFSLVQIGLAESVFHMTSLLFELPSGIIADAFGRKRALAWGPVRRAGPVSGIPEGVPGGRGSRNLRPGRRSEPAGNGRAAGGPDRRGRRRKGSECRSQGAVLPEREPALPSGKQKSREGDFPECGRRGGGDAAAVFPAGEAPAAGAAGDRPGARPVRDGDGRSRGSGAGDPDPETELRKDVSDLRRRGLRLPGRFPDGMAAGHDPCRILGRRAGRFSGGADGRGAQRDGPLRAAVHADFHLFPLFFPDYDRAVAADGGAVFPLK